MSKTESESESQSLVRAMDLPEIRAHVAKFFDERHHLAACALVSKSWYTTFNPLIWSEFCWSRLWKRPTRAALTANMHHVVTVSLDEYHPRSFPFHTCTTLKYLGLHIRKESPFIWKRLTALVRHNPGLQEIDCKEGMENPPTEFMLALKNCSNLRYAYFEFKKLRRRGLDYLLDSASNRLQTMIVSGGAITVPETLDLNRWDVFPCLTEVKFVSNGQPGLTISQQLQLVRKCPKLKFLLLFADTERGDKIPVEELRKVMATCCPLLCDLELDDRSLTDDDLASVADAFRAVVEGFRVGYNTTMGPLTFQALHRHFETLTDVDLALAGTSAMIHEVLVSCPLLTSLAAGKLYASDILGVSSSREDNDSARGGKRRHGKGKGRALRSEQRQELQPQLWICKDLENLNVTLVGFSGRPVEWQRQVFGQIARLKKLEKLSVGTRYNWPAIDFEGASEDGILLKVGSGMELLADLKWLKELAFYGIKQRLEDKDVLWMAESWPELRCVRGVFHPSMRERIRLIEILNLKGINAS
ncbi:hypothetical protein BGX28_003613 [Mortierella sp. GBA30]|nr:hypothetical protein BGX28_003613 [Mortierella sp. GBA30]